MARWWRFGSVGQGDKGNTATFAFLLPRCNSFNARSLRRLDQSQTPGCFFRSIFQFLPNPLKQRKLFSAHHWTFLFHATPPRSQRTDYQRQLVSIVGTLRRCVENVRLCVFSVSFDLLKPV
jgi:hypothetical protein